jgi:Na+-translocating ferredoxin:NAD+ oxidoreductase RnfD subunit
VYADATEVGDSVAWPLVRASTGEVAGVLHVSTGPAPTPVRTERFSFVLDQRDPGEDTLRALIGGANAVATHDGGYVTEARTVEAPQGIRSAGIFAALGAIVLLSLANVPVTLDLKLVHALPATIQTSIFVYWAAWWPPVLAQAPNIGAQLLLAFALDATLSTLTRRRWVAGLGPIPIVLSINLFLWFSPIASIAAIVAAMGSKALFAREGRHVFNPSAFAVATIGLAGLFVPQLGYAGLFHLMNLPPNITEWILCAALIPQLRVPIVLVTLGALIGNRGSSFLGPGPGVVQPPTLLAMALLATDPATIPRTGRGKLLFGLLYGLGIRLSSMALMAAGYPDDISKVLPIPLLNLLAPTLDRLGERLPGAALLDVRHNRAHVAAWFVLASIALAANKASSFEGALHWSYGTRAVVRGPDDTPTCEENPMFCEAFSVRRELGVWFP